MIRTAGISRGRRGLICALAALVLGAAAPAAGAQTTIRITRGDGAAIQPNGPYFRLGIDPGEKSNLLVIEQDRICCPAPRANPRPRCVSERQVPLGASRMDIVERYGPPGYGSSKELLRYSGIEFSLSNGRLTQICAVR